MPPPARPRAVWPALRRLLPFVSVVVAASGLALRLMDFGRYGFWNDEAWVALTTRVEGLAQFWLAISLTPVLWAATLRMLSLVPAAPELTLRLLPLASSLLTLWMAWRLGRRLAGHGLGGLLALVVLAFDPLSIQYAKTLKPYATEAWLALLAFDALAAHAQTPTSTTLARLALTLGLALPFAGAQLLVAPPVLAAAFLDALARRDRRGAVRLLGAGAAVGAAAGAYYALVVAPHVPPSMEAYFASSFVPATGVADALGAVGTSLRTALRPAFGPLGLIAGLVALGALAGHDRAARANVVALVLLLVELVGLSLLRRLPFREPRVLLFFLTLVNVHLAAALGFAARRLWARPALVPGVALGLGLALLGREFVANHRWRTLGTAVEVEDLGPLVARMEAHRTAGDGVLVYARSGYVYAYYQRPTPVLLPGPQTVGFVPVLPDPPVVVLAGDTAAPAVARAFAGRDRVWFVGSRFLGQDLELIGRALTEHGDVVEDREARNARLLLVRRRD